MDKIHFRAADTLQAQSAWTELTNRYGQTPLSDAEVVVAVGGDGGLLHVLHDTMDSGLPVYGMNQGSVGFLMNDYRVEDLPERLNHANKAFLKPLNMRAEDEGGHQVEALAINEVSLLRQTRQAAKLRISIDRRERLSELICDGILVSTPAGSTAYNLSAHGPILPLRSDVLAITPISAFRPRRWRGAILPFHAKIRFDILEPDKRPVSAVADHTEVRRVQWVEIEEMPEAKIKLLFDADTSLEERILTEQFQP